MVRRGRDGLLGYAKVFDFGVVLAETRDAAFARRALHATFSVERALLERTRGAGCVVQLLASRGPRGISPGVLVLEPAHCDARDAVAWALPRVMRAMADAASGLRELHARGIVHQDVKGANLLGVTRGGGERFALTDLGRAAAPGCVGPFAHHWVAGDRGWAPPELLFGAGSRGWKARGLATDAWLLGALMHELICGKPLTQRLWSLVPDAAKPDHPDTPTRACAAMWPRVTPVWTKAIRHVAAEIVRESNARGASRAAAVMLGRDFQRLCDADWQRRPGTQRDLADAALRWPPAGQAGHPRTGRRQHSWF